MDKLCKKCDRTLPISEFASKGKNRFQAYCKPCNRAYQSEHYSTNKATYRQRSVERRDDIRKRVQKIKEETPCTDCKTRYPYYVMQFDHLGDKEFNIAGSFDLAWSKILTEISKCEIVCSNCHAVRTHNRRS